MYNNFPLFLLVNRMGMATPEHSREPGPGIILSKQGGELASLLHSSVGQGRSM